MRRKDREMPKEFGYRVLDECAFATAALIDTEGNPYAVPLSIARDGDIIYFHAAKEGKKTDCLQKSNRICLSCVGEIGVPQNKDFTIYFASATVFGKAEEVTDEAEKLHGLTLITQRHRPDNMPKAEEYFKKAAAATAVWKIAIETLTAKGHQ